MEVSLLPFTSMEASMEVGENFHGSKSKKWNNLVGPPRLTRRETPLLPAHTTGNITSIAATDLPLLKQQHLVTLWVSGPTSTGMLAAASWGLLKTVSSDLDVASKLRIPGRCKRASKPYVIEQSPLRPFSWYKIACVAGESGDVLALLLWFSYQLVTNIYYIVWSHWRQNRLKTNIEEIVKQKESTSYQV